MTFALLSINDHNFQPLADLTWTNKIEYANRYGYAHACKTHDFYGVSIGFEKIWFIRDMMQSYSDIEWFWWTGCDSLITNMTVPLTNIADPDYHFIIATDCNGINADSFLIRNSEQGRSYIDMIVSQQPQYANHHWAEQQCIIDNRDQYKDWIKVVPQRTLNSYDYTLYPECIPLDQYGNHGQWQQGDLLIHWPGTNLPARMHLAQHYLTQVTR
jgi:hypothetical protein